MSVDNDVSTRTRLCGTPPVATPAQQFKQRWSEGFKLLEQAAREGNHERFRTIALTLRGELEKTPLEFAKNKGCFDSELARLDKQCRTNAGMKDTYQPPRCIPVQLRPTAAPAPTPTPTPGPTASGGGGGGGSVKAM